MILAKLKLCSLTSNPDLRALEPKISRALVRHSGPAARQPYTTTSKQIRFNLFFSYTNNAKKPTFSIKAFPRDICFFGGSLHDMRKPSSRMERKLSTLGAALFFCAVERAAMVDSTYIHFSITNIYTGAKGFLSVGHKNIYASKIVRVSF